jgi:DNA-binding SARP family transcriptional activator
MSSAGTHRVEIADMACSEITLVDEFALVRGGCRLSVPHMAERVLSYLALVGRPIARRRLAGALWPECIDQYASKSLRTALWRIRRIQDELVEVSSDRVRLDPDVSVDLTTLTDLAHRLIHDPGPDDLARVPLLLNRGELLPDWDEEWVVADRERYRLARLAALESAAEALLERHQTGPALMAASAVVQVEPLRESSRRIVMLIHLAQGNNVEAIREYVRYRELLRAEFGADPSPIIERLVLHARE